MPLELPPLPSDTILIVEVGSTAHGTGIPGGEDLDLIGIVVEPATQVLGLDDRGFGTVMQRTQPEGSRSGPGDIDRTLHSLRRFVRLAASGNPSILMVLWAPVIETTLEGAELQSLGAAFVGRHVIPRYRGYMESQARRLLGCAAAVMANAAGEAAGSSSPLTGTTRSTRCMRPDLGFRGWNCSRLAGWPCPWGASQRNGCGRCAAVMWRSRHGGTVASTSTLSWPHWKPTRRSGRTQTVRPSSVGVSIRTTVCGAGERMPTHSIRDAPTLPTGTFGVVERGVGSMHEVGFLREVATNVGAGSGRGERNSDRSADTDHRAC